MGGWVLGRDEFLCFARGFLKSKLIRQITPDSVHVKMYAPVGMSGACRELVTCGKLVANAPVHAHTSSAVTAEEQL